MMVVIMKTYLFRICNLAKLMLDHFKAVGAFTCMCAKSLQLSSTLCDPMDDSPPGFSVHGVLQARRLEWVSVLSSRGSS